MKRVFFTLIVSCLGLLVNAQANSQWIRSASISPDGQNIAFTHSGDIYIIPVSGGEAKPLTFHMAHDFMPVWSNDGSKITFASNRFGDFDVFVMDVDGGEAKRLTYHSNDEYPYSFTADNKSIVFGAQRLDAADHRQYPSGSQPEVYTVPVEGGRVNQLWTIPGEYIQVSKDGKRMVYQDKKGGENQWRKHHKSAITRDIWTYDADADKHEMITSFEGEDRNPVFTDDDKSIYYLSEESGSFNVHKLSLDNPSNTKQISSFELHPVRFLSISNSGKLCYTHHGELYTQVEGGSPQMVDVNIRSSTKVNNEQVIPVTGNATEMDIAPNGKEVVYVVRGDVFVSSVEGSFTKRITNTPEEEGFVSFTPDGESIIYAAQRDAKWGVYKVTKTVEREPYFYASTILEEKELIRNENDNYQPKVSPNGKEVAFIENRRSLKIFNIESKDIRGLLGPDELFYMRDGDQHFEWSPDNKWLLVEYSPTLSRSEIVLLCAQGERDMINLTESGFGDYGAKWVNGGEQIIWFSDRHGLRSYATSGSRQRDVYSMFFTRDGWDKFNMSKDEYELWKEIQEREKEKEAEKEDDKKKKLFGKKKKEEAVDTTLIKIDWPGLKERKKRLTIHSSILADAVLSKDGETLYYLARFEKDFNLWTTNLRTQETKMLIPLGAQGGSLSWDGDTTKLFMLSSGTISQIDLEAKSAEPIKISGELVLDIAAEREEMFNHVWKRTKEMFYTSDLHGAPWEKLRNEYKPKLSSIANDFEFVELLSEMLGELNVSHSGARYRSDASHDTKTASLGIFVDYNHTGQGIKIAEVIDQGPLDKSHINVSEGMIIKRIDGEEISDDVDFAKYLNRKAGHFTMLHIYDPSEDKYLDITMKPITLAEQSSLLYRRWVKINEEEVDSLTNGKLGYVHIPGMSDGPYRNTYERAMGKYAESEGLVIDTRFNGGGDLVSDLAMFLTGERFLEYATESRSLDFEPTARWTKPSVALVNEANYSDGHCFACGYQDLGIGLMIGMPVPGTCSFAGWEMLQNGKVLWGAVPLSAKNMNGDWLENYQAEPDVVIKNMPGKIDKGIDQQLERAVEELLKKL
ncbi:MAG: S41 family peptidase [Bacteroidales bacterium]